MREISLSSRCILCTLALCAACASASAPEATAPPMAQSTSPAAPAFGGDVGEGRSAPREESARARAIAFDEDAKEIDLVSKNAEDTQNAEGKPKPEPSPEQARTRSWFPEAFLWMPEVVTDSTGAATLDVTVPDQLTTWRILALAHDERGQQAGTIHTFDSTLPIYVDPVVPGWLYAGDRVLLPVQMTNTTEQPVEATVTVEATGAMTGSGTASLVIGPSGSDVRTLGFDVTSAGVAAVTATLASSAASDAAQRTIPVMPAGRPVESQRGGTLATSRSFRISAPPGSDPATEQLSVLVFPGALSVLELELERLAGGARPEDPAYGFALTEAIAPLAVAAGIELDGASIRKLRLLAWQRIVPAARAPDLGATMDLITSLRSISEHPQAKELLERLQKGLAASQRADGTWSRAERSTLQHVLVDTAYAARALPETASGPRLRAKAAIERYIHEVNDPYTAAVLLASRLVDGDTQDALMTMLTSAITRESDGEPALPVPAGIKNPWGSTPTRAEMLAWVVLALPAEQASRGDFAAQLMQGWSASSGFGARRADAVALEAVTSALGGISASVDVSLSIDGKTIATATLDPRQPKVPARLEGRPVRPDGSTDVEITINTSQGVPGLAFIATRRSYVPWNDNDRLPGVELEVSTSKLGVGHEGMITLTAVAPSGVSLQIEQPLPSGALIGEEAAQRLAALGASLRVLQDRVVVSTRPFEPGEILTLQIPVTPAFAGRFQTAPAMISADGGPPSPLRPVIWSVGDAAGS